MSQDEEYEVIIEAGILFTIMELQTEHRVVITYIRTQEISGV